MNWRSIGVALLLAWASPAQAQITVLDQAQDNAGQSAAATQAAPPPICGTQPLAIARMSWPSAALLAEIHARLLAKEFGCDARTIPGDPAATASSMNSSGQPAVAPEVWVTRIADAWNKGVEAQTLRPAATSYAETQFEGWFTPGYVKAAHPELSSVAALRAALPTFERGAKVRFISCPIDWACSIINRNLVTALGLADLVELIEPSNRFEMDSLIADAVSRNEAILFYYWQPNAILAQLDFAALDMGAFDGDAAKCLAQAMCEAPKPSAFPAETVVVALAEWVFTDIPTIAGYFQRATMRLADMNIMLAQLNEPGATIEGVADRFVAERQDVWRNWVGQAAP